MSSPTAGWSATRSGPASSTSPSTATRRRWSSTVPASTSSCRRCTARCSPAARPGCSTSARRPRHHRAGPPLHRPGAGRGRHGLPVRARRPRLGAAGQVGHRADDDARPEAVVGALAGRSRRGGLEQPVPRQPRPAALRDAGTATTLPSTASSRPSRWRPCCTCTAGRRTSTRATSSACPTWGSPGSTSCATSSRSTTTPRRSRPAQDPAAVMAALSAKGRDNARVPMPWDDSPTRRVHDRDALDRRAPHDVDHQRRRPGRRPGLGLRALPAADRAPARRARGRPRHASGCCCPTTSRSTRSSASTRVTGCSSWPTCPTRPTWSPTWRRRVRRRRPAARFGPRLDALAHRPAGPVGVAGVSTEIGETAGPRDLVGTAGSHDGASSPSSGGLSCHAPSRSWPRRPRSRC